MPSSLWAVLAALFVDGATLGAVTTPLLIQAGKSQPPWILSVFGGLASALGAALQLLFFRWALESERPWARRFGPTREKLEEGLRRYRRASFLGLVLMRATPVPDLPLKLVAAAGRYPIPLYALAVWLGALPYYYALAKLGQKLRPPLWVILAGVAAVAAIALFEKLRRGRARRARA